MSPKVDVQVGSFLYEVLAKLFVVFVLDNGHHIKLPLLVLSCLIFNQFGLSVNNELLVKTRSFFFSDIELLNRKMLALHEFK